MGFALRPGLSFCRIGSTLVFLDRAADRYFGLEQPVAEIFRLLIDERLSRPDVTDLVAKRLIERVAGDALPTPCCSTPPISSLLDGAMPPATATRIARATVSRWTSERRLRHQGLDKFLHTFERAKTRRRGRQASERAIHDVVASFERATLLVSAHERCLTSSVALATELCRLGLEPTVILGVKLGPFAAHCWVQLDDAVVSDRVEVVRAFTPILAL